MHAQNKKLSMLIQKMANLKVIVLTFLGLVFVMILVNAVFKQDFSYLTQTFNYTPQNAYQLLNDIGSNGRNSHLVVFLPDVIMVILYTILLVGANYAIFNKLVKSCFIISILTFSPLILSIIQITEIVVLTVVLLQYPNPLFALVQFANIITMIKTILTVVFFLMPLVGLCVLGIKKLVKQV